MSWTTIQDIKDRKLPDGQPLPGDAWLQITIDDMESEILHKYPKIQDRIDNSELEIQFIAKNVSRWIIDFLKTKGEPVSQESQSYTGAAARSVTYNSKARYSLSLSEEDLAVFAPSDTGIFMINIAPDLRVSNTADSSFYRIWGI